MPSEKYGGRIIQVVFQTAKEKNEWLSEAQSSGLPLSRYILELARRGREGESSRPTYYRPMLRIGTNNDYCGSATARQPIVEYAVDRR